jgi:hypothetical protein
MKGYSFSDYITILLLIVGVCGIIAGEMVSGILWMILGMVHDIAYDVRKIERRKRK